MFGRSDKLDNTSDRQPNFDAFGHAILPHTCYAPGERLEGNRLWPGAKLVMS
jgi:hypothetical protein